MGDIEAVAVAESESVRGDFPEHRLPHNNADLMLVAIVDKRDVWEKWQRLAVHSTERDAA